jgi:hypothetical protein
MKQFPCLSAFPTALIVAGISLQFLSQPVAAQTATSFDQPGTSTGAIACAPSNNGSGHMVCVQYIVGSGSSTSIGGVSWEVPPANGGNQPAGTLDFITAVAPPSGQSFGFVPSCAPANDNSGTADCIVYSRAGTSGAAVNILGIGFYPPTSAAASPLRALFTVSGSVVSSNPSCTSANTKVGTPARGAAMCAIAVSGQIYGFAFEPYTNTATPMTLLSLETGFVGNPSCASAPGSAVAMCAMQQASGLTGFAFAYNPVNNTVGLVGSVQSLGNNTFGSDPSCAIARNVAAPIGGGTYATTCGIVGSAVNPNPLLGITFDLKNAPTAYMTTATAPIGNLAFTSGTWQNRISCASPNAGGANNTIACVAIATTNFDAYAVNFDPRTGQTSALVNSSIGAAEPSCISINIDMNQVSCGALTVIASPPKTGGFNIAIH